MFYPAVESLAGWDYFDDLTQINQGLPIFLFTCSVYSRPRMIWATQPCAVPFASALRKDKL